MNINAYEKESFTVIELGGEIDLNTSPQARDRILKALKACSSLIIDLKGVEYIDSSGIASLIEGLQMAKKSNITYILTGISGTVMQVFQLARLESVFDIQDSIEDVLAKA